MKKKLWSRLVSLMVVSAMALMILPVAAFAANDFSTDAGVDEYMTSLKGQTINGETVKDYNSETNTATIVDSEGQTYEMVVAPNTDSGAYSPSVESVTYYNYTAPNGVTYDSYTMNLTSEKVTLVKNGVPVTTMMDSNGNRVIKTGNGNEYTYTTDDSGNYKITDSNGTVVKEGKEADSEAALWEIAEANQAVASSASSDGDAAFAAVAVVGAVAVGTAAYFLINPDQWLNVRNTVRGWVGMEQLEPELPTEGDFWLNVSNTLRGWFGMEPLPCKPAAAAETVEETAENAENGGEVAENGEETVQTEEVGAAA